MKENNSIPTIRRNIPTILIAVLTLVSMTSYGDTEIAKWRNNADGAFTMSFDDSMETHATIALPEVVKRGLVGTWFINPADERYITHRKVWEEFAPENNQELANHTMTHEGADSFGDADYEIGECARIIWKLRKPGDSLLQAFARGGQTVWDISGKQMQSLKDTYHCINRTSELSCKTSDNVHAAEMIAMVDQAIKEERWVTVHFHGIGGQWLPIDKDDFLEFLDYLESNSYKVWSAGWVEAHQYATERDRAQITVLEEKDEGIRLNLVTGLDTALYTEELTLMTDVPEGWDTVTMIQGAHSVVLPVTDGIVQYEAKPDQSPILLKPGPLGH